MARLQINDLPHLKDLTSEQLKDLFGAGSFRPQMEALEGRLVPATSFLATPIYGGGGTLVAPPAPPAAIELNSGRLVLTGDQNANRAHVYIDTLNNTNPLDDQVVASITRDGQTYTRRELRSAVTDIVFGGNAGNDDFTNSTNLNSVAYGGAGDDIIYGGSGRDRLFGDAGNDHIHGGAGNDDLFGGDGSTYANDLYGNDVLHGDAGSDLIKGEHGHDLIIDLDHDIGTLDGGSGDDVISAGRNKVIYGGDGKDAITGGGWIYGGAQSDTIYATGYGINTIFGEDGDDWIYGSAGFDTIYGGAGNDNIDGGAGNDLMYGGAGNDFMRGGAGHDSILGDGGEDTLHGDAGNDLIYGGDDGDAIYGGGDDDKLYGGDGWDLIHGGAGNDYLNGGFLAFSATSQSQPGDTHDDDYDDLWGDAGADRFSIGDQVLPYWWDDTAWDVTSEDSVNEQGWITWGGVGFEGKSLFYWGHLYGTGF